MRRVSKKLRSTTVVLACLSMAVGFSVLSTLVVGISPASAAKDGRRKIPVKTPPKGSQLHVVTDKLSYNSKTKIAVATGKVVITYGKYILVASKVVYDKRNDKMRAIGSVHMREPGGNILQADVAQLENKFRDGFAKHLRLLLTNDATLTADYAKRSDGNITVYQHVTYTRCKECVLPNGEPLWQIRSVEVTHNEDEGIVYHKDASFEFLGATVAWFPYLSHPDPTVKRRTGFLIPEFNFSSTYGFGVGTPYFINLAPNYDVTLRPFFTTKQGPLARATWRHRLAKGEYNIDAAGIYQLTKKGIPAPGNTRLRGFVRTVGDFNINKRWTWGWDATAISDDTFARRYDIDKRSDLINQAYLTGINKRNYFSGKLMHFRGLLEDDRNKTFPIATPFLRYNLMLDRPVAGGDLGFETSIYSIHRRKNLSLSPTTANQAKDQTRATVEAHWNRRMVSDFGTVVTPFARLRSDIFVTDRLPGSTKKDKVTARLLPTGGFDARMPFVGNYEYGQHVFTPIVQFISSPNETKTDRLSNEDAVSLNFDYSNLFLQSRFTGKDRFEGGTRMNVGVMNNWMFSNGGFLRVSAGQSYHLAGRNSYAVGSGLKGNYSDLVAAIAFQPNQNLQFSYQARLDDRSFAFKTHEVGVQGKYGPLKVAANYLNVASAPAYARTFKQEQVWGNAEFYVSKRWSIFGGSRYDLRYNKSLERNVGIGYHCDCFGFKLEYKESNSSDRDADTSRSIMMSVEFKTLGSGKVGSGL